MQNAPETPVRMTGTQIKSNLVTMNHVFSLWKRMVQEHLEQSRVELEIHFPSSIDSIEEFSTIVSYLDTVSDSLFGIGEVEPITEQINWVKPLVDLLISDWNWKNEWLCRRTFSLLVFMTRTSGDRTDLADQEIQNFLALDNFDYVRPGKDLNRILMRILSTEPVRTTDDLFDLIRFRHGPGSTSDAGRDTVNKTKAVGIPISARNFLSKVPFDLCPPIDWVDDAPSELTVVPKNYKRVRTIAAESVSGMYVQQAMKEALYSAYFDRPHTFFGKHCYLRSVEKQNWQVMTASLDNRLATIDLSSASDRVSLQLVEDVFTNTILEDVISLRANQVNIPGKGLHTLAKYASMGNALSFPVETIIFCLICCEAIELAGDEFNRQDFSVYGDDIIIGEQYVPYLLFLLKGYGFIINDDKSFFGREFFRESCGFFYFRGNNVTPLRISRFFSSYTVSARNFAELKDLVFRLEDYDFPDTAKYLRLRMAKKGIRLHEFGFEEPTSYDNVLQRSLTLGTTYEVSRVRQKELFLSDDRAYYEWLFLARKRTKEISHPLVIERRPVKRERPRWRAVPCIARQR